MKSKIILSGMEFYAYHGCFVEEKIIGTRFKVDVVLYGDFIAAAKEDDLQKTVNYQSVYKDIETVMKQPVNILETLAFKIIEVLKKNYLQIDKVKATVYKLNPALGGKTEWVAASFES
jgi:dihydroneopterin aldolase